MSRCVQSTAGRAAGRLAVLALLAWLPAACAQVGLPFGGAIASKKMTDAIRTSSLVKSAQASSAGVDGSDWEAVRRTLAAEFVAGRSGTVDWTNPDTGSSGTITTISTVSHNGADACRYFATTIHDIHGVRRYRGEICQDKDRWRLTKVQPDDAVLS